jgi:NADH-quinone oxidoreductase subunit J
MNLIFYLASTIAILSTILAISRTNAIHALLYLIISLLSISVIFYIIGAPFIAALEVIVYAGAIMVLFIFVVMMLNIGLEEELEHKWLKPSMWIFPSVLAVLLMVIFIYALTALNFEKSAGLITTPKQVGISLFTTYILGVEISAILLMAGIIGAYHLGKQKRKVVHRFLENKDIC